jgi:hypothetical protein
MRSYRPLALLLLALPAAAQAQSMNADAFYQRATALQKKGMMALFAGGEIKLLMAEGQAAGKAAKAQWKADKDAGRQTRFCPPPGPAKMRSDEYMKRLGAISQAERMKIDLTEATVRIMAAKFPC